MRVRVGGKGLIGLAIGLLLAAVAPAAIAAMAGLVLCGAQATPQLQAQQLHLRVSAVLREALARHPEVRVALMARDGTDLRRWGIRHSHAGLAFREHAQGPWTVRQLYYDCEGGEPSVFDQGLAGFLHGSRESERGSLLLTLLPDPAAALLEAAALDDARALSLLHPRYSANAYAFNTLYQNCNQWLAEIMALAWGGARNREEAQAWLQTAGYAAQTVQVGWRGWLWLSRLSPWLHLDDHPPQALSQGQLRISLPEALARWVGQLHPQSVQLQICWQGTHLLLRSGAAPLGEECEPQEGDERHTLAP